VRFVICRKAYYLSRSISPAERFSSTITDIYRRTLVATSYDRRAKYRNARLETRVSVAAGPNTASLDPRC
jgi:hypothetical protein